MALTEAERTLRKSMVLYDDAGTDADDITDQELAVDRLETLTLPPATRRLHLSGVLRKNRPDRSKYNTARGSRFEMWNEKSENLHEVKVHIRDTKLLTKAKWDELVSKGTTNLVIEDDDSTLKTVPVEIAKIQTLRSLTLMWTKVKTMSPSMFKIPLQELIIKKCPLKGIEGIHTMKQLTTLELTNDGLTCLPAELGEMSALASINFSGNNIKSLPMSIGNLRKLKSLTVSSNKLSLIPMSVTGLTSLETLDASHNQIDELPELLGNLANLTTLRLTHNHLSVLPGSFRQLHKLKYIFLSNNEFVMIPGSLSKLPELQTVNFVCNSIQNIEAPMPGILTLLLDKNDMMRIPMEVFGCTKLEQLSLQHNHIASIPREIRNLTKLRSLSVSDNDIDNLPNELCELSNLRHLVIRKTNVSELPVDFDSLQKLSMIDIEETNIDFQVGYALKNNGIAGLLEHVHMMREQKVALLSNSEHDSEANSDRGSSIFDEEDESASDHEDEEVADTDSGIPSSSSKIPEPDGRDSGYTDEAPLSTNRKDVKSMWPAQPGPVVSQNQIAEAAQKLKKSTSTTSSLDKENIELQGTNSASAMSGSSASTSSLGSQAPDTQGSPDVPPRKPSVKSKPATAQKPSITEDMARRFSQTSTTSAESDVSRQSTGSKPKPPAVKPKPKFVAPST